MNPYQYFSYNQYRTMYPYAFPPQHQDERPGIESIMIPVPISNDQNYIGSGKLMNKIAIITGGDSGIGRAVSIAFAKEGADVVIVYLSERENEDATDTKNMVELYGRRATLMRGDITDENFCKKVISETIKIYGKLDILVNNAGVAYINDDITTISIEKMKETFNTNIFSYFYMTKYAVPYMKSGSTIINTSSIAAFEGISRLVDYSATKGAVVSFTKALAAQLIPRGIRVNAVAPNYTWTPLIPSTYNAEDIVNFGRNSIMGRAAQPFELAPTYVLLASNITGSYLTGKIIEF